MLTIGDKVPSITVPSQQGASALPAGETLDITTAFPGKWKVLFYWPKDFTFVCPTEIVAFSDAAPKFAERNTQLLGASIDSQFTHLAWCRCS